MELTTNMDLLPNGVLYRGAMTGREGRSMRHGSGELLEDIAKPEERTPFRMRIWRSNISIVCTQDDAFKSKEALADMILISCVLKGASSRPCSNRDV